MNCGVQPSPAQPQPHVTLCNVCVLQTTQAAMCEDHLMRAPVSLSLNIPGLPPPPSPTDLPHTKDIENHPATQVTPFLFLGNMTDASDAATLQRLGIDHVLNVTAVAPSYATSPAITYKQLHAADNGAQNIKQYFEEAFSFIDVARDCKGSVLIHCQAGVSRSPTIAIAYLIKYFSMSTSEAYKFIKLRRSIISPNLNFMGQLLEFEKTVKGEEKPEPALAAPLPSPGPCYKPPSESWRPPGLGSGPEVDRPASWLDTTAVADTPGPV